MRNFLRPANQLAKNTLDQLGLEFVPTVAVTGALALVSPENAIAGGVAYCIAVVIAKRVGDAVYQTVVDLDGDEDSASDQVDWGAFLFAGAASVAACVLTAGNDGTYSFEAMVAHVIAALALLPYPRAFRIFSSTHLRT